MKVVLFLIRPYLTFCPSILYCKCVGLSVFNMCPMLLYVLKLILVRTCLKRAAFGGFNRSKGKGQLFDFPFIYKKSQELYPSVSEESLLYKYISPLCLHSKCRLKKNMPQVQRRFVYSSKFTIRSWIRASQAVGPHWVFGWSTWALRPQKIQLSNC